jgi:DNA-3-methyladenine glycosylase II
LSEKADGRDTALATLRKADPVIAALIDANPDYDPDAWLAQLPKMDAFGVLVFQVIGQQLSVAVTRTMLGRLMDRFGGRLPTPKQLLAADPEDIRAAGLSRRKVQTLRELAGRFVDGRLDPAELERLPDEEVVARLTEVSGVGRWTAEGFLAIALRREDVVLPGILRSARRSSVPTGWTISPVRPRWWRSPRHGDRTAAWPSTTCSHPCTAPRRGARPAGR